MQHGRAGIGSRVQNGCLTEGRREPPRVHRTLNRGPESHVTAIVGQRMARKQEPVAVYRDFEFTFAVVAGRGVVRTR
jgi:hypothetical protein